MIILHSLIVKNILKREAKTLTFAICKMGTWKDVKDAFVTSVLTWFKLTYNSVFDLAWKSFLYI